jgi:KaiC/GvpD/RAD55 family RecA-like ATPase
MKKRAKKEMKRIEKKLKPKKIREIRVPTGIDNFDRLVEGGFEKNSTNLIVGDSGSGKTIFAVQFLIDGMKRGEKCL